MLEGDNGYTRIFGRPLGAFDTQSDDSKKLSILKRTMCRNQSCAIMHYFIGSKIITEANVCMILWY